MDAKNIFPCIFNDKRSLPVSMNKQTNQLDLDKVGQSSKELNPYWKNGGNGLPCADLINTNKDQIMDANWLKKSLLRAQEEAESKGRCLEEIAAERWGSLEVIQSMILKAEKTSRDKLKNNIGSNKAYKIEDHRKKNKRHEGSGHHSNYSVKLKNDHYKSKSKSHNQSEQHRIPDTVHHSKHKPTYKKPTDDDCPVNTSHSIHYSRIKKWQKSKISDKTEENELNASELKTVDVQCNSNINNIGNKEIQTITESELNKLGAKIVKAEIMGDIKLAAELKNQLKKARELATNTTQLDKSEKDQTVILTRTDTKGVTRPLESRSQFTEPSENVVKKNVQTHSAGKRMLHYYDDDKYSLQQMFQREKGRSTNEDDALFAKVASKNMNMDEIFEEQITRVQSNTNRDEKDRSLAIKEHKRLSKSLDTCHWCIDSKYMLKHMIIAMNSEICLSLPPYTSLTEGHCIITPVHHIACQLQLDENIWEKLKVFKRILYDMFTEQNKYPVFYESYKNRHKFLHMQLECVPLPKKIGELIPMYFKKALLECETEWSMNKKVIELEHKDIRKAIPNGLSYFMIEFESGKGYAHVIEDEHLFPTNFAEEIIGGMLDLNHDVWRKPKKENFNQQREKVLKFLEMSRKYDFTVT
nr:CWF19-like protein 2 isoform X2 [Nomia melanderi]